MLLALLTLTATLIVLWLYSLRIGDASLIDTLWSLGFMTVSWILLFSYEGFLQRQLLLAGMRNYPIPGLPGSTGMRRTAPAYSYVNY